MTNLKNIKIETERLILQPATLDYAQDIFSEFNDDVASQMRFLPSKNIQQTKQIILNRNKKFEEWTDFQFVVLEKNTKEFIWCCGIKNPQTLTPTIGLWVKVWAQWKWYGKEIIGWLLDWANQRLDFEYIKYDINKENIRSIKIVESFWWMPNLDSNGKIKIYKREVDEWKPEQFGYQYKIYPNK